MFYTHCKTICRMLTAWWQVRRTVHWPKRIAKIMMCVAPGYFTKLTTFYVFIIKQFFPTQSTLTKMQVHRCSSSQVMQCIKTEYQGKSKNKIPSIWSQEAWSGLSSCCGHCWRYDSPDCPPVVDLFLSTGIKFFNIDLHSLLNLRVMHMSWMTYRSRLSEGVILAYILKVRNYIRDMCITAEHLF